MLKNGQSELSSFWRNFQEHNMLSNTVKTRLTERFSAPQPDEFHKRRLVFWLDEDGEFADSVDEFSFSNVTVIKLTGKNNFAVKKLLVSDDLTGDYLIYDPLSHENDGRDDWLLDIKLYSEEFRADLVSLQMEELLVEPSSIMRQTMKQYAKFFEDQENNNKLKKIGRTYHTPGKLHIDIMAVLCGLNGGSAQDVLMAVLTAGLEKEKNAALAAIEKFGNIDAFWAMVNKYTGYLNTPDRPLSELAIHILISALAQTMPPSALKGISDQFVSNSRKAYCYQLVDEWQHSHGNCDLKQVCRFVEQQLRLADRFDNIDISVILKSDIFPAINESILKRYFAEISEGVIKTDAIFEAVRTRRTMAWYDLMADYFESLYYIAKMQEFYLSHIKGFQIVEPLQIWTLYLTDAYKMDSHYRHFHFRFRNTLQKPNSLLEDALIKCSDEVEKLYCGWFLTQLTSTWTKAIADNLESLGYIYDQKTQIKEQRMFYYHYFGKIKNNNPTFVIISDALRYEVAAELYEKLCHSTQGKVTLEAMQSEFPSITKFGMAALLPGKEISVNDKIEVFKDGAPTSSTIQRDTILKTANPNSLAVTYDAFRNMNQPTRLSLVKDKKIIYIYHNKIDAFGDKATTEMTVFEACNTAITELSTIVNIIESVFNNTKIKNLNIFITADHGFLYTYKQLEENQKISRQTFSNEPLELGRRYALVTPETTADYLLPVTGKRIGGLKMKGYAPQDIVRIKVQGGGENYVHGGISLQEIVVPVIVYNADMQASKAKNLVVQNPGLTLISESRKVSNLMFVLNFLQKDPVGTTVQPCKYTLHFVDDAGSPVSDTQTIIADKTDGSESKRVFQARFTLKHMQFNNSKIYRLVIANEVDIPEEIEFHFDLAFTDDYGF
jgi:uncharacterized protein (TIGR02687 family)